MSRERLADLRLVGERPDSHPLYVRAVRRNLADAGVAWPPRGIFHYVLDRCGRVIRLDA
jgi:hypothetical protein